MTVIEFENVSKQYRLGVIGTGTLHRDLNRWWAITRGREDPYTNVGQEAGGLVSSFGEDFLWALKDVSLKVEAGEVLGIIGNNGSGKSTLLKIVSRITKPTAGVVKIKGRIASLLEVGTGFHEDLTGRENVFMNGAILGMAKSEIVKNFDEIVHFSGVEKYIDTPIKRYSSGMQVKLAFSIAAHLPQEIMIIDEVLAVGDWEFQHKARKKIHDISINSGKTVLFVSHNMDSVRELCVRGIVLNAGRIVDTGEIGAVVRRYTQGEVIVGATVLGRPEGW